jgi:hypothetical protein
MDHARLLNDSSVGTREKAARFLSALVVSLKWSDEHNRMVTATPGSVENLVRLLQEPSAELRKNAAIVLRGLAHTYENQVKIAAMPGSVDSLVRLLQDSSTDVGQQAALTLQHLTYISYRRYNVRMQVEIAAIPGLLEHLVRLLQHPWPNVKLYAATVLKSLASCHPENQVKIAAIPGSLESLMLLLQEHLVIRMKSMTIEERRRISMTIDLLQNLAEHPGNQVKIAAIPGLLESLVRLLQGSEHRIAGEAARALGGLAHIYENQVKIAAIPDSLKSLARLSQAPGCWSNPKTYSIGALANLAANNAENQVKIAAIPGLLESLVQSLKEQLLDPTLAGEAARALANLACNAIIKMNIEGIKAGVMVRAAASVAPSSIPAAGGPSVSRVEGYSTFGEMAAYVPSYVEPEVSNPKADRAWYLAKVAADRAEAEAEKQPRRDLKKAEYDFAHTFYSSEPEADMARAQLDLLRSAYSHRM